MLAAPTSLQAPVGLSSAPFPLPACCQPPFSRRPVPAYFSSGTVWRSKGRPQALRLSRSKQNPTALKGAGTLFLLENRPKAAQGCICSAFSVFFCRS